MIGVVQGLLLGCLLVGTAWFIALLILGVGGAGSSSLPELFTAKLYLLAAAGLIVVGLAGGWLTAFICTRAVSARARREMDLVRQDIDKRMAALARELVVAPAEQELEELEQFRADLRVAAGEDISSELG